MTVKPKAGETGTTKVLYQRIRGDIETKIASGDWQPGHRVPSEHELMKTYSCSRMSKGDRTLTVKIAYVVFRRDDEIRSAFQVVER
jgi:GntR family histidine utilization transcriptional repressor